MEESISHPIHTHSHLPPPPKPHQSFPQTCSSQLITHSNCIYGGTGTCGHRVMPWQNRWKNTFPASNEKVRQVDRQSQCREGGLLLWAECYEPGTQPSWGWSAEEKVKVREFFPELTVFWKMNGSCSGKAKDIPGNLSCTISRYEIWNEKVKFGKESQGNHRGSWRLY